MPFHTADMGMSAFIDPVLNTLDSLQTRRSDRGDITEAIQQLKIVLIGKIMAPILIVNKACQYRYNDIE
jgi:hypothetical protein